MKYKWNKISIAEAVSGVIVLLITVIIGYNTWSYYQFESNFNESLNAYGSKRFGNVMGPLNAALNNYGSWPYALLLKARMLAGENQFEDASSLYKRVAENNEGALKAAALIGRATIQMRQFDRNGDTALLGTAEKLLGQAASTRELQPDVKAMQGQLYLRRYMTKNNQKFLDNAKKSFKKAIQLVRDGKSIHISPLYDLYSGQANIMTREEKFRQARIKYDRLYHLNPDRIETLANRGYAMARYYDSDRVSKVMTETQQMMDWTRFSNSLRSAGKVREDTELGQELLNAAFQLQMSIALSCYKRHGGDQTCRNLFEDALIKMGDNKRPVIYASRGIILLKKAEQYINEETERHQRRIRKLLNRSQSDFEKMLQMELPNKKTKRFALNSLATVNYHMGTRYNPKRLKESRELYEEAKDIKPDYAPIYRSLTIAYYSKFKDTKRNWELSRKYGEKYLEMNPDDSEFKNWFEENF